MADVIQVQRGFAPWQPSPDAELVKEYRHYDIPLEGVIAQHGSRYYFMCVYGPDEPVSFWYYSHLTPTYESSLDKRDDTGGGPAAWLAGSGVVALAIEGPGVVASVVIDELTEANVNVAVRELTDELSSWASAARELQPAG